MIVIQSLSSQTIDIEDEQGQVKKSLSSLLQAALSQAALKESTNSTKRDLMDEEILDDQIQDASIQYRTEGYNEKPPEEINTYDANQDDNNKDSLDTVSDLSFSREPFEKVEVGQFHYQDYFKHFFHYLPNPDKCPPVPEKKERDTTLYTRKNWKGEA
eukprot:6976147-Ditylum_brightwellii.AAC.1